MHVVIFVQYNFLCHCIYMSSRRGSSLWFVKKLSIILNRVRFACLEGFGPFWCKLFWYTGNQSLIFICTYFILHKLKFPTMLWTAWWPPGNSVIRSISLISLFANNFVLNVLKRLNTDHEKIRTINQ